MFLGFVTNETSNFSMAENLTAEYNGQKLELDISKIDVDSFVRKQYLNKNLDERLMVANKLLAMGFSVDEVLDYVFPNFRKSLDDFAEKVDVEPTNAMPISAKNCKIEFKKEKNGLKIDKNLTKLRFLTGQQILIESKIVSPKVTLGDIKNKFLKCGEFSTKFSTSTEGRVNNIRLAVDAIDGKIVKKGETFSFNEATGARSEQKGYKSAKIIVNGRYVEGFGGGVCQVSSTLYNAAIMSGLKITEVHPHSLPSFYVEPCFDAMVNSGSADLKIYNQTDADYLITACADKGVCRVVIYGVPPECTIVRRFEKFEENKPEDDIVVDGEEYGLAPGEEKRISWGADGFKSKGYIDYYRDGVLIKSEQIRNDVYKPKRGVVAKG